MQVGAWKKELAERIPELFVRKNTGTDKGIEKEREQLERKVGQLTMEADWLEKKFGQLGAPKGRNS